MFFSYFTLTANEQMDHFSTEYFLPIKKYSYGIPLKCNGNNITDGIISVYNPLVSYLC